MNPVSQLPREDSHSPQLGCPIWIVGVQTTKNYLYFLYYYRHDCLRFQHHRRYFPPSSPHELHEHRSRFFADLVTSNAAHHTLTRDDFFCCRFEFLALLLLLLLRMLLPPLCTATTTATNTTATTTTTTTSTTYYYYYYYW